MKKRFIVLIDFSEYSSNLLKYAYTWSIKMNAELLLLHRSDVVVSARLDHKKREDYIERIISEKLDDLKTFTKSTLQEIPANCSFRISHTSSIISNIKELLKEPYDNLVFAGLKGTGLMKKLFIGSVAVDVIENTDSIVAAIPKDVANLTPSRLMLGIRNEFPLNINALNTLLEFWEEKIPNINFFTIVHENDDTSIVENHLKELAEKFSAKTNTSFSIYKADNFSTKIKEIINNNTEDILVVQKGSRLLKDQLMRKFLINELIYEGKTTLITLP